MRDSPIGNAGSLPMGPTHHHLQESKDRAAGFARRSEIRLNRGGTLARRMPLEGHYARVNTPLRRLTPRERNVGIGAVVLAAIAILAVILATAGNSSPKAGPGCIYAIIPGVMGAEPVDACGGQAEFVCGGHANRKAPSSQAHRNACREANI